MSIVGWFNGINAINGWVVNTVVDNSGVIKQNCYLLADPNTNTEKLYNGNYLQLTPGTKVRILSKKDFSGVSFYNVEYIFGKLPFTQNWLKLIVGISLGALIATAIIINKDNVKSIEKKEE